MNETTAPAAAPLTDPGPPPPAPEGLPTRRDRFFDWVRGFGLMRTDGWLGGVCAGLAARLRVDPLIIRGVFVVAALLGLPMLIIYAIAWALLPDHDERIPFQSLLRGRFEPALIGVLVVFLLGLIPVVPWAFGSFLGSGIVLLNVGAAQTLTALLIIAIAIAVAFLISRLHRRHENPRSSAAHRARASTADARPEAGAPHISGVGAPALFHAPAGSDPETVTEAAGAVDAETEAPAAPADDDELAAWRAQQAAWKEQEAAWRRQQQDAERAARAQARREREEHSAAFAAEAAARRQARRASKPRASIAYIAVVIGAAVISGAVVMLVQADRPGTMFFAPALGLLTAALVAALGMIVAGAIRRRSGFLAFFSALLLVLGLGATVPGFTQNLWIGDAIVSTGEAALPEGTVTHPWGTLFLNLNDTRTQGAPIVVDKSNGYTLIQADPGVELILEAELGSRVVVEWEKITGGEVERVHIPHSGALTRTISGAGAEITTRQTVRLTQDAGMVRINTWEG